MNYFSKIGTGTLAAILLVAGLQAWESDKILKSPNPGPFPPKDFHPPLHALSREESVIVGETFTIDLPVQGSVLGKGSWGKPEITIGEEDVISYKGISSKFHAMSSESGTMPVMSMRVGAPSIERHNFKTLKPGMAKIEFKRGDETVIVTVYVNDRFATR